MAKRKGYMSVREAAVRYEVSRAKLHRLIQTGRLETAKDPRDERITLLRNAELESLFTFPAHESEKMEYKTSKPGTLTADMRSRIDAVRMRVSGGRTMSGDSAAMIREQRERRSRHLYETATGAEHQQR